MADRLEPLRGLIHRMRGAVSRHKHAERTGLRVVRDPEDAEMDIVAVHGLGGQGFRSWTTWDSRGGKPRSWLEELLGADISNARIMTYGYISDGVSYRYIVRNIVYGQALHLARVLAAQRLRDHTSHRPLFFIAHSLGGWIVERALIISSEAADPELKDIELSTAGVALFGTLSPDRSSSPSPLAHVIRRTSGLAGGGDPRAIKSPSSQEPHASDMEWLEHQMQAFKGITSNLPRLSFYETEKTRDGYVVEQRHSIAGSDGTQIGLQATHPDLIRFRGRDENYQTFIGKFREMVRTSTTSGLVESKRKTFDFAAVHRLGHLSSQGYSIPYRLPNESCPVVPRRDLIDRLEYMLDGESDALVVKLGIVSIWGPGGTGKSALARCYVERNRDHLAFVFWIRAESWETVVASYLELANTIVHHYARTTPRAKVEHDLGFTGLEDMLKAKSVLQLDTSRIRSVVRAVKDWLLRPDNVGWLLVFDNVEPSYDIFDFIPLTLSGRVILTSQDGNCCSWGATLRVDAMDKEEAIGLLEIMIGDDVVRDATQAEAAAWIVQQLAFHPQSIAIAAATIKAKGLSVSEYQMMIESRMPPTLSGSTLHQSPVTRTVLQISSMLSPSIIPAALFGAVSPPKQAPERLVAILEELRVCQESEHLDDVLQYLFDQNFIQTPAAPSDTSSSTILPSSPSSSPSSQTSTSFDYFVVDAEARDHVRSTLSDDDKVDHAWMACRLCVDGIRLKKAQSSTFREMHDFGRIIGPHAKICFDDWSGVLEAASDEGDIAWHVLGQVCMTQGALDQAMGCFELSLRQRPKEMDVRERIEAILSLSSLLRKSGKLDRSREILADINMDSVDQALGFRVALARASATAARGELSQAGDQYETLEAEQEAALGPTDLATVSTVQQLASTLERLGKLEEAQALYRRVYISFLNTYGQIDRMTIEALEDLANIYMEIYAIDEAESLYKQCVDVRVRALGADHPQTAYAIQNLAVIDDLLSRYGDARTKYQHALDIIAPTLGKAHPLYTTTMENLALSTRRHAHSLAEKPATRPSSSPSCSQHSSRFKRPQPSKEDVVLRGAISHGLFEEAERLYLDTLAIKKSAKSLYADTDVVSTGSKLAEMYENEEFFASRRDEKFGVLKAMLREGRRRETV